MDPKILYIIVIIILFIGCAGTRKRPGQPFPKLEDYDFERSLDQPLVIRTSPAQSITVRFDGVPFSHAMRLLSDLSGICIVFDTRLDNLPVTGNFHDVQLSIVLDSLARRVNSKCAEVGGVYYLGELTKDDTVSAVVPMVPIDESELHSALSSARSEVGTVSMVGSTIWIMDRLENVRKIVNDLETIRKRSERSYVAEVFFLRVKEDDFVKLTGDLRINAIDVFSSSSNMDELFSMFLDASASSGIVKVDQRPTLFLSEGRKATFEVGSEIVREKKTVGKEGNVETTGYEKFQDGLNLSLKLARVSELLYMIDFDLTVSYFDGALTKDTIPTSNKSSLKLPGLLCTDGKVFYIGSLRRKESTKVFNLFGIDSGRSSDFLTIWIRIREVKK